MPRRFFGSGQRQASVHAFRAPVDPVAQVAERSIREEHLLTPEEVAHILRLPSVKRVYDLIHLHHLPARRIGRQYRIEESELQAWTKGQGHSQAASR